MSGFADTTSVAPEKTRAEIESLIAKYKADAFSSGWGSGSAYVAFRAHDRFVKFVIRLPDPADRKFRNAPRSRDHDQAVRTIWRRLLLCIKAKLESVASGIETFETAFMAHIVVGPHGQTVGEWLGPQLDAASRGGTLPLSLPAHQPDEPPRVLPHPQLITNTGS